MKAKLPSKTCFCDVGEDRHESFDGLPLRFFLCIVYFGEHGVCLR